LRLDIAYQQRFLVKIGLVAAMLAIAIANKLYFTPLLKRAPARGAAQLGAAIGIETIVALAVLAATAWALDASPDM
jgi:putative copper export protein